MFTCLSPDVLHTETETETNNIKVRQVSQNSINPSEQLPRGSNTAIHNSPLYIDNSAVDAELSSVVKASQHSQPLSYPIYHGDLQCLYQSAHAFLKDLGHHITLVAGEVRSGPL